MKPRPAGLLDQPRTCPRRRAFLFALVAGSLASLVGCATGSQARSMQPSGFLGEYRPMLQPGKAGEEDLLIYRSPNTNWAAYTKVHLEPVEIWSDPNWKLSKEDRKDLQKLVQSFQDTLTKKLAADYEIVEHAGPGAIRMQVAITNGQRADMILKVVSKGVPYGSGASFLWTFITGKPPFVGEASIETIIKDGPSGDLLWASADRRVGADTIVAGSSVNTSYLDSWGDVKYSLDYWSDDAVYRLCSLRGGMNCVKPKKGLKLPS